MTEQEINNLIDSKIGKTKMSQLPEATQTSGLYSIGYNGNQSVKYKANLLQGDPLTVRKTYQTEALALADKNPIDTTTSLPLTVGQFVSIVDDGEKNGIYRIGSIGGDGTMSLELQGKLGDLSEYAKQSDVELKADKFLSIINEIGTGQAVVSRSGNLFTPSEGGDMSTYSLNSIVDGLDVVYYTGRANGQSGGAFLNKDGTFHSTAIELQTGEVYDFPIAVPEGAYYINVSSRQSDVVVDLKANANNKLSLEIDRINERIIEPIKTSKVLNDANFFRLYFKGDASEPRLTFDDQMSIANEGDYVEVVCSTTVPANSKISISMFVGIGKRTRAGIFDNQFYFRSDSTIDSDYRKWSLPIGLDLTQENSFKLLNSGTVWELFINGESQGTQPISPLANIHTLFAANSPEMNYTYKSVTVKTLGVVKTFSGIDLLSQEIQGGEIKIVQEVTQSDLDDLGSKINVNSLALKNITDVGYYSSFNSQYPEVKSSLSLSNRKLNTIGDYVEIEARYNGTRTDYVESLYLFTFNNNLPGGWYNENSIFLRAVINDPYLRWDDLEANRSEWNKIKFLIVESGIELFVNDISQGVRGVPSDYSNLNVTDVAAYERSAGDDVYGQKYDVGEITVKSAESGGINISQPALYELAENVLLVPRESKSSVEAEINPLCFVSYVKDESFKVYVRDRELQDQYYMFNMELYSTRGLIDDEIAYAHFWKIASVSARCVYNTNTNTMSLTSDTLLTAGESECVYMSINEDGESVDFTGGVHGDESIDIISGDFMRFYVDGVPLTETQLAESFDLMPCSTAYLLQKSSMHKTAYRLNNYETTLEATGDGVLSIVGTRFYIDGVDSGVDAFAPNTVYSSVTAANDDGVTLSKSVGNKWQFSKAIFIYPDHPVMAKHLKKTTFKDQSYETENTLIFQDTQEVSHWFQGICCLSKKAATFGHNENYEEMEFTGSLGSGLLSETGLRLFETYNPTTKMSAKVESWLLDGGGIVEDKDCIMHIWDRATDSKYYRKTPQFTPEVGTKMKSVMKVSYNYRKDEE